MLVARREFLRQSSSNGLATARTECLFRAGVSKVNDSMKQMHDLLEPDHLMGFPSQ